MHRGARQFASRGRYREGEVDNLNLFAQQGFSSLLQYPRRAGRYLQETCLEGRTFAQCPSLFEQVV